MGDLDQESSNWTFGVSRPINISNLPRRPAWNADRIVGQKEPFTVAEVIAIAEHQIKTRQPRDLALLALGCDSFLRCGQLLELKVERLVMANGQVRPHIPNKPSKRRRDNEIILTEFTRRAVLQWIRHSGKRPGDFLFTALRTPHNNRPLTAQAFRKIVKSWASLLGLMPELYSTHSLRRTKVDFMIYHPDQEVQVRDAQKFLGHASLASTEHYIMLKKTRARRLALKYDLFDGLSDQLPDL